jgi:hypothetical protein
MVRFGTVKRIWDRVTGRKLCKAQWRRSLVGHWEELQVSVYPSVCLPFFLSFFLSFLSFFLSFLPSFLSFFLPSFLPSCLSYFLPSFISSFAFPDVLNTSIITNETNELQSQPSQRPRTCVTFINFTFRLREFVFRNWDLDFAISLLFDLGLLQQTVILSCSPFYYLASAK